MGDEGGGARSGRLVGASASLVLRSGDVCLVGRFPDDERAWRRRSRPEIETVLRSAATPEASRGALRSLLHGLGVRTERLSDAEVVREVAARVERRDLAMTFEQRPLSWIPVDAQATADEALAERPRFDEHRSVDLHWIEIRLVDEEGHPVAGVDFELELPDGSVRRGATAARGPVRVDGIAGGRCDFSFPNLDARVWEAAKDSPEPKGREAIHLAWSWSRYDQVYDVCQGDSVESIAARAGHLWTTLWEHDQNAELRSRRKSGHVLQPGDALFVPQREPRYESLATDRVHVFRYRAVPSALRIQFTHLGVPRRGAAYRFEVDGEKREGVLDGDGVLEQAISPVAERALVRFVDEIPSAEDDLVREALAAVGLAPERSVGYVEEYPLRLRHLDPTSAVSGAQGRLRNLGFDVGDIDGELDERTRDALRGFQGDHGLDASGELDEATQRKLHEMTHD